MDVLVTITEYISIESSGQEKSTVVIDDQNSCHQRA